MFANKKFKKILQISALGIITLVSTLIYIQYKPLNWHVYDENSTYLNLKKNKNPMMVVLGSWQNKNLLQAVYNASNVAEPLKSIDGKVVWLVPASEKGSLESAQLLQKKYNLNVEIYLAPKELWDGLIKNNKEADENHEPITILIKNGKEIETVTGVQTWFSNDGLKNINKYFDSNLLMF